MELDSRALAVAALSTRCSSTEAIINDACAAQPSATFTFNVPIKNKSRI